ncbi:Thromboxane-A synthase, partial [Rhizophlyctis rosea]
MPTNQNWKHHRSVLVPAFSPSNLRFGMDASLEAVHDLCTALSARCDKAKGGVVELDIYPVWAAYTLDVIGKVGFSYEFKTAQSLATGEMSKDVDLLNEIFTTIAKRAFIPSFLWHITGNSERSPKNAEAIAYIRGIVTEVIQKKRSAREEGGGQVDVEGRKDLLDQLMGKDFSDEEIFQEVLGFFLAGHETTSNTLMFILLELCRNPHVYAKLMEEITSILPTSETLLTWDLLPSFKYLDQVIKESQRIHAVVGGLGRTTAKDITVLGHHIPRGTFLNISIRQIQWDERYWPSPRTFDPERFAEGAPQPVAGSYLPFGDGGHNCIGSRLALIETKVGLVEVLRRFEVGLVEGREVKYKSGVTTTVVGGVWVRVKRRGVEKE